MAIYFALLNMSTPLLHTLTIAQTPHVYIVPLFIHTSIRSSPHFCMGPHFNQTNVNLLLAAHERARLPSTARVSRDVMLCKNVDELKLLFYYSAVTESSVLVAHIRHY